MSKFTQQDWQAIFSKAAQTLKLGVGVELVEVADADFIVASHHITYQLVNHELQKAHIGPDVYFATPILQRIIKDRGPILPAETLQITRPQILRATSNDAVLHTVMRYALVEKEVVIEEPVETEAERIAREEEEELQALIEEEEREKEAERVRQQEAEEQRLKEEQEAQEKERLEKEEQERAAEAQRLREAENQQQNPAENPTELSDDNEFQEEQR